MKTTITLIKLTTTIATIVTQMAIINAADLTVEVKRNNATQKAEQQLQLPDQMAELNLVLSNMLQKVDATKKIVDQVLQTTPDQFSTQIEQVSQTLRMLAMQDFADNGEFIKRANDLSEQITTHMSTIDHLLNESLHPHDRELLMNDKRDLAAQLENLVNDRSLVRDVRQRILNLCSLLDTKKKIISLRMAIKHTLAAVEVFRETLRSVNNELIEIEKLLSKITTLSQPDKTQEIPKQL